MLLDLKLAQACALFHQTIFQETTLNIVCFVLPYCRQPLIKTQHRHFYLSPHYEWELVWGMVSRVNRFINYLCGYVCVCVCVRITNNRPFFIKLYFYMSLIIWKGCIFSPNIYMLVNSKICLPIPIIWQELLTLTKPLLYMQHEYNKFELIVRIRHTSFMKGLHHN